MSCKRTKLGFGDGGHAAVRAHFIGGGDQIGGGIGKSAVQIEKNPAGHKEEGEQALASREDVGFKLCG